MKHRLDAPFLEMGLYFAAMTDADAFASVARTILAHGSRFIGAAGWRGPGKRAQPFTSIRGDDLREHLSIDANHLQDALIDPNLRIMEISFDQIIGISKAPERLEYVSVFSEEASLHDHHPIVVLAEGEPFSGPHDPERGRKPGKRVYQTFRQLVTALSPSYACITVERATECPTDLHRDPRHFSDDFFINRDFIGTQGLDTIAGWFAGTYQEPMGNGMYISTYQHWNPRRIGMDTRESAHLATEVGRLIGQRRPSRPLH